MKRPDRDELLAIRDGVLSYDALVASSERMRAELEDARRATKLPADVDAAFVDALCVSIVEEVLRC